MLVFVYGSLLRGMYNNERLLQGPGAKFVSSACTQPGFTMVSLGGFPGVVRGGTTSVRGEVYEVDVDTLAKLDMLEGHPNMYRRETELVEVEHGRLALAFIYIWCSGRVHFSVVEHGDWRKHVREGEV